MYVCSGIKGEIDKDTCREATKIAFSAHTFLENALRIFYVTVKILAARQSLLPTESTVDCTEQHRLQRGRKSSRLLQRKCFKWQLTASSLRNGCWGFRQNSILSGPLLLAGSLHLNVPFPVTLTPSLPNPSFFRYCGYENVFRCLHFFFFYLQLPSTDSLRLNPIQKSVSAQAVSPHTLRKSSCAQRRPRGYFYDCFACKHSLQITLA